jgi:hypothetical protein
MVRLSTETCRDTITILYQCHFVSSFVHELVFDHIFSVTSRAQCGPYYVLVGVPICFQNHTPHITKPSVLQKMTKQASTIYEKDSFNQEIRDPRGELKELQRNG